MIYGVLVKQYHASLSNLRPGSVTRIPRHFMRVRKTMSETITSYVVIFSYLRASLWFSGETLDEKSPTES